MRVLFLTIGPEAEPSSRFRVYQYLTPLRELGIEAQVLPRVGRAYFEMGYGLRRPRAPLRAAWSAGSFAARSARRLRDLCASRRFDVVVIQKETFAFGMERLIPALDLPVVYDFDDAIYARPRGVDGLGRGVRAAAEAFLRRERALAALLPHCRAVLAGSQVLADYARHYNRNVEVLPTVVDTDAYAARPVRRNGSLVLGWLGAPANAVYLEALKPVLAGLAQRFDFRLRLLGPTTFDCPGVTVETRGWKTYGDRAEEAADLADFDIGLMPLSDDEFAAGKCGLKAIQYMASGIPVVASAVGANREVVSDGSSGFLARSQTEWRERLARLLVDPDLRARMGRAGRARAERHYSLRSAVPRLARVLESARRAPTG